MAEQLARVKDGKVFANKRLAWTNDERLVADTDAEASALAYPEGEEIPADIAKAHGLVKQAAKSADKAKKAPENKAK